MPPPRRRAIHGVILVVTAMMGAQTYAETGLHRSARNAVIAKAMTSPAEIFDSTGLLGIAGATVLMIIWLQRQASCRRESLTCIAESVRRPISSDRFHSRRSQLNSIRLGGRHGP